MKPLLIFLLAILIFTSCEKDPAAKKAPEIPPVETMFVDISAMENINKSVELSKTNWIYSATTVSIWNLLVWSTFAVPAAAFKAAVFTEPVVTNDVTWTWEWKYAVPGFNNVYNARLVGTLETASTIKWEMYISKSGDNNPFTDFLWFEGTSNTDGKSGQWILYHSSVLPERTVLVDWKKEAEEVGEVSYTYVRKLNDLRLSDNFNGSTLIYGLQNASFDAYLHIHAYNFQTEGFADTEIEWSRFDYTGHIKAEHFFNDTEWHCWDSAGNDINCN